MKLLVKNVAKVKNAEIEIAGITTLIGYNSTGKSTVSRSLVSIGEMFSKFDEKVEKEKLLEVSREMERWEEMYRNLLRSYQMQIKDVHATKSINMLYNIRKTRRGVSQIVFACDSLEAFIDEMYRLYNVQAFMELEENNTYKEQIDEKLCSLYDEIKKIKDKNFTEYEHNIIGKTLNKYFNNQYCSYYNEEPMHIVITNENDEINSVCISMNGDIQYEKTSTEDLSLIYIQPEHILDGISILNLNLNMDKTLNDEIDENETSTEREERIKAINIVNSVISKEKEIGNLQREGDALVYMDAHLNKNIDITNVASGAKNIVMLKRLAEIGKIRKNTILVFDEPEQNLHPEWQLMLAELLVVLQKEVGLKVFINTHSPYFLRAIEYYSDRKGMLNMCKFYYMTNIDGGQSVSKDMTFDLGRVYDEMAAPLDKLLDEGYGEDEEV